MECRPRSFRGDLFYESWPDFEEFLELQQCPSIELRPVNVIETSGHTSIDRAAGTNGSAAVQRTQQSRAPASLKTTLKKVYRNTPLGPSIASHASKWMNYSLWSPNKARLEAALRQQPVDILHIINGDYPGATTARIAAVLEGVPYVILQALSQAKPVIATMVGGIPETILSGETGLLVPPRDPEALSFDSLRRQQSRAGNGGHAIAPGKRVACGANAHIQHDRQRSGPLTSHLQFRALKLMQWQPEVSLNDGPQQTIDWIKQNPGLYQLDEYHV